MKKYFARWVPVGGEIKVGDDTYEKLTTGEISLWHIDNLNDIDIKNQVKVKLFLCTKDVKPGDKIFVEPDAVKQDMMGLTFKLHSILDHVYDDVPDRIYKIPIIEYTAHPNPKLAHIIGTTREWIPENVWKPIGEISSEATWVKEDDQFDEDEILPWHVVANGTSGFPLKQESETVREDWRDWLSYYKIKGPCGHYH